MAEVNESERWATHFLKKGPPWVGESSFKHKEIIKSCGARWNQEERKWEARSRDVLLSLLKSQVWMPAGQSQSSILAIIARIKATEVARSGSKRPWLFERRKGDVFDEKNDTQRLKCGKLYVYATQCKQCGDLLDSRCQFGFECSCTMGSTWYPCVSCLRPVRLGGECPVCVH